MSATSNTATTTLKDPSLGALECLSGELRNAIYELVICTEDDPEADYYQPCHPQQSLPLVSKKIHTETKAFVELAKSQPCNHTNFAITLKLEEYIPSCSGKPYNIAQAKIVRFVTGRLGGDAPLAVTCCFPLPDHYTFDIFGASAQRLSHITEDLQFTFGIRPSKALTLPPGSQSKDMTALATKIRGLSLAKLPLGSVHARLRRVTREAEREG